MEYIRLTENGFSKARLISKEDFLQDAVKNRMVPSFYSLYYYNQEHKDHFDKENSVAGLTGQKTNKLWFDIDLEDNLEQARDSLRTICERLETYGVDKQSFQITFSGNKGFHLVVDTTHTFEPNEVDSICSSIAQDLPGFDTTMYDSNQVLRVPHTKHPSTGLFCRYLTLEELNELSIDQIKEKAKSISNTNIKTITGEFKRIDLPKKLTELKTHIPKVEVRNGPDVLVTDLGGLEFEDKPPFLDNARYAIFKGFFSQGERSHALMCMAATYKNLGFDKEDTHRLLKSIVEKQEAIKGKAAKPFTKEEIWSNIISQVYGPHWRGGQYSASDPTSWLYKFAKTNKIPLTDTTTDAKVVTAKEGFFSFLEYAKNSDKNSIKTGLKELDDIIKAKTQHLIAILAPPGVGKTSLALEILNHNSLAGVDNMLFSYDMGESTLFQKLVQRETGLTEEVIFEAIKKGNVEVTRSYQNALEKNYENTTFLFKSGQTIKDIKKSIIQRELMVGRSIPVIVIDYSELVLSQFSDPTQASSETIQGLREIANEMNKCVFILLQPNKVSSKPTEPLLSYSCAKGSSSIAQAVTTMITMHRPGQSSEHPEGDIFMGINVVKSRMSSLGSCDFSWLGNTGKIRPLDVVGKMNLKRLRDDKKAEKETENKVPFSGF